MRHLSFKSIRLLALFLGLFEFVMIARYYLLETPIIELTTVIGAKPTAHEIKALFLFTATMGVMRLAFAARPREISLAQLNMAMHVVEAPVMIGLMFANKSMPTSAECLLSCAASRMSVMTTLVVLFNAVAFTDWYYDLATGVEPQSPSVSLVRVLSESPAPAKKTRAASKGGKKKSKKN